MMNMNTNTNSNKKRSKEKCSTEWTDKIIIPFEDEWSEPSHE